MASELSQRISESSSQNSQSHDHQAEHQAASEEVGWNPQQIPQFSDLEERNRYHYFHREWVVRTYGSQATNLPPQHFFQDPTSLPYLRNAGMTVLGMYI